MKAIQFCALIITIIKIKMSLFIGFMSTGPNRSWKRSTIACIPK